MEEYISREAFYKILESWRDAHADVDDADGCGLLEDVMTELNAQPAANVAPVVRCKDCKHYHWKQEPCHGKTEHLCDKLKMEVFKDFYCWFGKKKGDNENG